MLKKFELEFNAAIPVKLRRTRIFWIRRPVDGRFSPIEKRDGCIGAEQKDGAFFNVVAAAGTEGGYRMIAASWSQSADGVLIIDCFQAAPPISSAAFPRRRDFRRGCFIQNSAKPSLLWSGGSLFDPLREL
jgi:hypothetical protein